MAGSSLVVFNDQLLDSSAGRLGPAYGQQELLAQLQAGLLDQQAFGIVPGAAEAHGRLAQAVNQLTQEYVARGLDLEALAADARASAEEGRDTVADTTAMALQAEPLTMPAAGPFRDSYAQNDSWE